MKRVKKKSYPKSNFLIVILILIISTTIFFINYEKDCKEDMTCFNSALENCKTAKVTTTEDNNLFRYNIEGKQNELCIIHITLVTVDQNAGSEIINSFEGKGMKCELLENTNIMETSSILDSCSGPLKEAIYESIIEKMYGLIIENLSETISSLAE
ncbi:hypothetical protein HOD61_03225 [archaeon]|jgi:hypothetical protein|nr:hypothetical protein [archaeon]